MRFLIGAIVLFAISFGLVFLFSPPAQKPGPVDIVAVLGEQSEEYAQIYSAFQSIGSDDLSELDRSILAFSKHEDQPTLRQEIGGLMVRAVKNHPDSLSNAGLPALERVSRETLAQIRRYQEHGPDFCDVSIRRDYANAEIILHNNLPERDAVRIIDEIKQARFHLAVTTLEAVAEGTRNPVPVPDIKPEALKQALLNSASDRQDRILEQLGRYELDCDDIETVIVVGLSIPDRDSRHAALADAMRH
jgi:hypothetical protein